MENKTFTMIKPDITGNDVTVENIKNMIIDNGFIIDDTIDIVMTQKMAEEFYSEHKGEKFYEPLIKFMTSGKIIAMVLIKDNAIKDFRKLIGSTNPDDAEEGTIRKEWGNSTQRNAIHGSDSEESMKREIEIIFG